MSHITHTSLGTISLTAEAVTSCASNGTYYDMVGTFTDGALKDFTLNTGTGVLTYTGSKARTFCFFGTSDMKSSKVAVVTYALAKNGNIVTDSVTPTTFDHANSYSNISIIRPVTLNPNDTVQIRMKSDTDSTDVTVATLNMMFMSGVTLA